MNRSDEEKLERITADLKFYQRRHEKNPSPHLLAKINSLKVTRRHYMTLEQIRNEDRAAAKTKGLLKA